MLKDDIYISDISYKYFNILIPISLRLWPSRDGGGLGDCVPGVGVTIFGGVVFCRLNDKSLLLNIQERKGEKHWF